MQFIISISIFRLSLQLYIDYLNTRWWNDNILVDINIIAFVEAFRLQKPRKMFKFRLYIYFYAMPRDLNSSSNPWRNTLSRHEVSCRTQSTVWKKNREVETCDINHCQ